MDEGTLNELQAIILSAHGPRQVEVDDSFALIPPNYEVYDVERFLPRPRRERANVKAESLEAFIAYLERYGDCRKPPKEVGGPSEDGRTVVFASLADSHFHAVLDYHHDEPSHCTHHCRYSLESSLEWKAWVGMNGASFSQVNLARFLEENLVDIQAPEAAAIMEMATGLRGTRSVAYTTEKNLTNGAVQLSYQETVKDLTTRGNLEVPEVFSIAIPVYDGDDVKWKINGRLRYRINGTALSVKYDLDRLEETRRKAFSVLIDSVEEVGFQVFLGSYGASR